MGLGLKIAESQCNLDRLFNVAVVKILDIKLDEIRWGFFCLTEEYIQRAKNGGLSGAVRANERGVVIQINHHVFERAKILDSNGFYLQERPLITNDQK